MRRYKLTVTKSPYLAPQDLDPDFVKTFVAFDRYFLGGRRAAIKKMQRTFRSLLRHTSDRSCKMEFRLYEVSRSGVETPVPVPDKESTAILSYKGRPVGVTVTWKDSLTTILTN